MVWRHNKKKDFWLKILFSKLEKLKNTALIHKSVQMFCLSWKRCNCRRQDCCQSVTTDRHTLFWNPSRKLFWMIYDADCSAEKHETVLNNFSLLGLGDKDIIHFCCFQQTKQSTLGITVRPICELVRHFGLATLNIFSFLQIQKSSKKIYKSIGGIGQFLQVRIMQKGASIKKYRYISTSTILHIYEEGAC